jgi:hypothetical protein
MKQQEKIRNEEEVLLTFLKRTAEGEYATIEEASLPYARIQAQAEVIPIFDEDYYYSFS